jgi:hypothetical protein
MTAENRSRDLEQFVDHMKSVNQLNQMKERDRDELLTQLYEVAQSRMAKAFVLQREQGLACKFRTNQKIALKAIGLYGKALKCVHSAKQICDDRLIEPQTWGRAASVENQINALIASLSAYRQSTAVRIHPKLRNQAEKQLAGGHNECGMDLSTGGFYGLHGSPGDYPIGKAAGIDQWFIGQVDGLLCRYRLADGGKITRHDIVISELFNAAFGERGHGHDSIRIELRRQKQKGAPRLVFTGNRLKRLPRERDTNKCSTSVLRKRLEQ